MNPQAPHPHPLQLRLGIERVLVAVEKNLLGLENSQLSPCTSSFYKFELHLTRLFFYPKSQINLITFCIESWQGIAQYMTQDAFHIM